MSVPRWLSPKTNPALYTALASIALSVWQAIQVDLWRGSLTLPEVGRVAAPIVVAALVAWQRGKTTPLADPKDAAGRSLVPSSPPIIKFGGELTPEAADAFRKGFAAAQTATQAQPPAQPPAGATP